MAYVQGEVVGDWKTPTDLVHAIRSRPRELRFTGWSEVGTTWSGRISDLPSGMTLTIWGPYRLWTVTLARGRTGFMVSVSEA